MTTYAEKLRDPRWKKLRQKIIDREQGRCEFCPNVQELPLHVHHEYYEYGREPWEYPPDSLRCVCEDCHKMLQAEMNETRDIIKMMNSDRTLRNLLFSFHQVLKEGMFECTNDLPTMNKKQAIWALFQAAKNGMMEFRKIRLNNHFKLIDATKKEAK
jgi:hypothetical protein